MPRSTSIDRKKAGTEPAIGNGRSHSDVAERMTMSQRRLAPWVQAAGRRVGGVFNEKFVVSMGAVTVFLLTWEAAAKLGAVNPSFASSPSRTGAALVELLAAGVVWPHARATLVAIAIASIIASVIGIIIGGLTAGSRVIEDSLAPLTNAGYATPLLAMLPLIIAWFGFGISAKVTVGVLAGVFPVIFNTFAGFRNIPDDFLKLGTSFCAGRVFMFRKVLVPAAIPEIMTGLRLGAGRVVLGVIVTELYASTEGVGNRLMTAAEYWQVDRLMAWILVAAILAHLIVRSVESIERRIHRSRGIQP